MSQGPGLEFKESMSGWIGIGQKNFVEGRIAGQQENTPIRFDAKIIIDDLDRFIHLPEHRARLEGTVTFNPLGGPSAMEEEDRERFRRAFERLLTEPAPPQS